MTSSIKNWIYIFLLIPLLFFSCKKENKRAAEPPMLVLLKVEPTTVTEFKDSVMVTFSYYDANGDLGNESPDEYALEVKDSRLPESDWYHVKPLAPLDYDISIEGELTVKMNSMFLLGNGDQEMLTLTMKIQDRAGNWSNEIVTDFITVEKDTMQ